VPRSGGAAAAPASAAKPAACRPPGLNAEQLFTGLHSPENGQVRSALISPLCFGFASAKKTPKR